MVWDIFLKTWPAGKVRKARKEHRCDYNRGWPLGMCTATIRKGDDYFDPGDSNPARAGGFGGYRYCKACASLELAKDAKASDDADEKRIPY